MENLEIKKIVAKLLNDGLSLSAIQKELQTKHNLTMTFLDLRILASELEDVDWSKQEPPEKPAVANKDDGKAVEAELLDDGGGQDEVDLEDEAPAGESSGKTVVELNKVARPGAIFSGSVKFGSGASADWVFDQLGRLSLEKAVGQPTQADIRDFQTELQKILSRGR